MECIYASRPPGGGRGEHRPTALFCGCAQSWSPARSVARQFKGRKLISGPGKPGSARAVSRSPAASWSPVSPRPRNEFASNPQSHTPATRYNCRRPIRQLDGALSVFPVIGERPR